MPRTELERTIIELAKLIILVTIVLKPLNLSFLLHPIEHILLIQYTSLVETICEQST